MPAAKLAHITNRLVKAAAVVFCDFNSKAPPEEIKSKMDKSAAEVPCPVFAGYPYGHSPNTSIIDFRRNLTISPNGELSWAQDCAVRAKNDFLPAK